MLISILTQINKLANGCSLMSRTDLGNTFKLKVQFNAPHICNSDKSKCRCYIYRKTVVLFTLFIHLWPTSAHTHTHNSITTVLASAAQRL